MAFINGIWLELSVILGLYIQSYLFHRNSGVAGSKYKKWLPYFICFIWVNLCFYFRLSSIARLGVQVILFTISARYVYDMKILSIGLKAVLYTFVLVVSEAVVMQVWDIFDPTPITIEYGAGSKALHYSLQITIFILTFGIIFLVDKILLQKEERVEWRDMVPFIVSMLTSFAISCCILFNLEFVEEEAYIIVFLVCSLLLLLSFIYNAHSYGKRLEEKQREHLERTALFEMKLQKNYYQQKLIDEERIRSVYHDLKNHLLILEERHGNEKLRTIRELREKVADFEDYCNTGNEFLDIVIKEKSTAARQKGITVTLDLTYDVIGFMNPLDISSIFGNLFDNAIEACCKIEDGDKFIDLRMKIQNSLLIISMKNTISIQKKRIDYSRTSKEDKLMHGMGIKNIGRSVNRYGGDYSISQENHEFQFYITIPINKALYGQSGNTEGKADKRYC